jgi:bla regulator protein BlaR1
MILYLLKSILCLGLLLLVYLLFLEKEKMHRFNRWYLLCSIVFAFIVPLISFTVKEGSLPALQDTYFEIFTASAVNTAPEQAVITSATTITQTGNYQVPVLIGIYLLITSMLLARFTRNIYRLLSSARKNKIVLYRGASLVLLKDRIASHTFLNYIFINEDDYNTGAVEDELITHELTHVKEKHSWDVIFIELMQTLLWFNPLFLFYKKAIQLNHEYLADDAVIKTYENVPAYQYLLLEKVSLNSNTYLTSNFNYSVTKKRFVMMTKTTNRFRTTLKQLSILPVAALTIFVCSSKELIAQQKVEDVKTVQKPVTDATPEEVTTKFKSFWLKGIPHTEEGISQADWNTYLALENKYTQSGAPARSAFLFTQVTDEDKAKMESLFVKMNLEQQSTTHVLFTKPIEPSKAEYPTEAQVEKWKNPDLYGVWLDGKKISNEVLNKYKAADFPYYSASKLYGEAKKSVKYAVQLDLMTKPEFDKMNEGRRKSKGLMMVYLASRAKQRK